MEGKERKKPSMYPCSILPCLRSQGEGSKSSDLPWEQVGEGAAVICSRHVLVATLSRWETRYHCAQAVAAASGCPVQGEEWVRVKSTGELFSK